MVFNSYVFVFLFLPFSIAGYYLISKHSRNKNSSLVFLTLMSLIFYGYNNAKYVPVIVTSICLNWCISRWVGNRDFSKRKFLLVFGIAFDIAVIFYFKYYDFFIENFNNISGRDFELRHIALPLGISFFTFQQISFIVDAYRGETREYNFIEYASFVCFFPQLVAGPIVLHNEMIPQLSDSRRRRVSAEYIAAGIRLFSYGLFKKVLLADSFAKLVNWGFDNYFSITSLDGILISLCYTFQIYFDFSGYCDMATGIAKLFNIDLPINFDSPYKSFSIREFWKRWHMTLTRFLTKYIYYPLGGNRKGHIRTYINIIIVFLTSGLWHGANWTFILWGLMHGCCNVMERIFEKHYNKVFSALQWLYTFSIVNVLWLLFRSDNIVQWCVIMKRILFFNNLNVSAGLLSSISFPEFTTIEKISNWGAIPQGMIVIGLIIVSLLVVLGPENNIKKRYESNVYTLLSSSFALCWCIVCFSMKTEFIYFNF